MDEYREQLQNLHLATCKKALENNGFHAVIAEDRKAAVDIVNGMIQDGDLVCDGGSMTLKECGLLEALKQRNIVFQTHNDPGLSKAQSDAEARKAFAADVFLASANALTLQGEIINVDGHGNRVSAMIFGPKKVILVVGVNKLVQDEDAARRRIKEIAAPANSIRLHKKTPCAVMGNCRECHSQDRICSSYVKLNYDKENRIYVVLVKTPLGY